MDVEQIVEDYGSQGRNGREDLDKLLTERQVQVIDWNSYKKIDSAEKDAARLRREAAITGTCSRHLLWFLQLLDVLLMQITQFEGVVHRAVNSRRWYINGKQYCIVFYWLVVFDDACICST